MKKSGLRKFPQFPQFPQHYFDEGGKSGKSGGCGVKSGIMCSPIKCRITDSGELLVNIEKKGGRCHVDAKVSEGTETMEMEMQLQFCVVGGDGDGGGGGQWWGQTTSQQTNRCAQTALLLGWSWMLVVAFEVASFDVSKWTCLLFSAVLNSEFPGQLDKKMTKILSCIPA